jgi:hypothetical protein
MLSIRHRPWYRTEADDDRRMPVQVRPAAPKEQLEAGQHPCGGSLKAKLDVIKDDLLP